MTLKVVESPKDGATQLTFRELAAEISVGSSCFQKIKCRAFKELSIGTFKFEMRPDCRRGRRADWPTFPGRCSHVRV
jgi:hypothetical protein